MRRHLIAAPKTFALLLAIALTLPSAHARADTYPRQPGVDAEHYVFRLTLLTTDSNEIEGEATVRLRMTANGVKDALLDLTSATPDGKGMTVTRVTSNGQRVRFTHEHDRVRLPLPANVKAGDEVTFDIAYHGAPANGLRLLNNIHGERTAFSENWFHNARQWLPTIDHIADKATVEFIVTTKAEYQVISNGLLMDQVDLPGSLRRTHWSQDVAVSPWLYSLGIAHFVVHYEARVQGTQLSFWAFPQDTDKGLKALERDARGAFQFFSNTVGPYAYQKLAHVEAAGMDGSTEHATNIFYGEKGVTAGNAPVVHETAHQWFGDAVTENDWNDVWLSEGFATYFTLLYTEHSAGHDAFIDGLRRSRDRVLQLEKTLPNTPVVHVNFDESKPAGPNNPLVYQKGGWTLHMLRDQIGTDAFWRGIRLYYQAHMNGFASTADLRGAMEQASGQDLSWFFSQWLTRSGVPSVEGAWRYDAAARQIVVTIRQAQTADPYRFQMGVGVVPTAGAVPQVVEAEVTGRETSMTIPADAAPVSVVFDPNVALLADIRQPEANAIALLRNLPSWTNATDRLSGDQNGQTAPVVPGNIRAVFESSRRTHKDASGPVCATNTMARPSGETAVPRGPGALNSVPSGADSSNSTACGDGTRARCQRNANVPARAHARHPAHARGGGVLAAGAGSSTRSHTSPMSRSRFRGSFSRHMAKARRAMGGTGTSCSRPTATARCTSGAPTPTGAMLGRSLTRPGVKRNPPARRTADGSSTCKRSIRASC